MSSVDMRSSSEAKTETFSVPVHPSTEPHFSIAAATRAVVSCGRCGNFLSAGGPTGCLGREPICDVCLLEGDSQLGMLVALGSVARLYAQFDREDGSAREIAAAQLLAFARIYDRFAHRFAPMRELNFEMGFVGGQVSPADR